MIIETIGGATLRHRFTRPCHDSRWACIIALTLVTTAVACGSDADRTGPTSLADMAGREWALTHLSRDETIPTGIEITLRLEEGRLAGRGGCNRYFAGITEGERLGVLSIGPVGSTRMACPAEVMEVESRYLRALEGTIGYENQPGRLVLTYREGDTAGALYFAPGDPAPADPEPARQRDEGRE